MSFTRTMNPSQSSSKAPQELQHRVMSLEVKVAEQERRIAAASVTAEEGFCCCSPSLSPTRSRPGTAPGVADRFDTL
jgi:hypothetical protein